MYWARIVRAWLAALYYLCVVSYVYLMGFFAMYVEFVLFVVLVFLRRHCKLYSAIVVCTVGVCMMVGELSPGIKPNARDQNRTWNRTFTDTTNREVEPRSANSFFS